jgi:hypothetical protein
MDSSSITNIRLSLLITERFINNLLQFAFKYKDTAHPPFWMSNHNIRKFDLFDYYGTNIYWSYIDSNFNKVESKSKTLKTYMNFSVTYV